MIQKSIKYQQAIRQNHPKKKTEKRQSENQTCQK